MCLGCLMPEGTEDVSVSAWRTKPSLTLGALHQTLLPYTAIWTFAFNKRLFWTQSVTNCPSRRGDNKTESLFCRPDLPIAPTYCHYKQFPPQSHTHTCPSCKRKDELWLLGQRDLWKNRKLGETSLMSYLWGQFLNIWSMSYYKKLSQMMFKMAASED